MRRFALSPSIRGRLVIGVALVHAVLMTFFVTDLVHRQRVFLHGEAEARALGLSQMVATTSVSWVLANDVKGLSEVMGSVAAYPDVAWAMVVDDRGQVLGHTDETLLQRWVVDARYRAVLTGPLMAREVIEQGGVLETAAPVIVDGRGVGWAVVAIDLSGQSHEMRAALREGLIYTAAAILVGTVFALWIARALTRELAHLGREADRLRQGERGFQAITRPSLEVARLESAYHAMAETIWTREDELTAAAARLKSTNAELERFGEVLAHHLQEPVRLQFSFAQRLERLLPPPLPPEAAEALAYIQKGALRLRALLRDVHLFLSVARLPQNADSPCSVDGALDAALSSVPLQKKIQANAAVIERGPLPVVKIDGRRLTDVFAALLDNALEYRRANLPPRITVTGRVERCRATLCVADNGIGIPPEFRERVLGVFERLESDRGNAGTGIGLALVRKIVELAGGRIWIEDSAEGGTMVCLDLPAFTE